MKLKLTTFTLLLLLILSSCSENKTKTTNKYLSKVLKNLDKIESATYSSNMEIWNPGDTAATFIIQRYFETFKNPSDTTIGSSWIIFYEKDKSHLELAYDGKVRALVYDDEKSIMIDSFKFRKLPFRPIRPTFYNYTKSILQYALETKDSIALERENLGDVYYLKLTIFEDTHVEFFGKAYHMAKAPFDIGDPTSKYELWIEKSTNLPYKIRREMSHTTTIETVSDFEFNKMKFDDFKVSDYFPFDYEIYQYGEKRKDKKENSLLGQKAPDWMLKGSDNKMIELNDLESKVVMIQFTSISCGPCRASIPILKKLSVEYDKPDFDLVAIECYTKNSNVLSMYQERNQFEYKFLMSTTEVNESYSVRATPVFFILDKKRIIRKIINGYGGESTDNLFRETINELI